MTNDQHVAEIERTLSGLVGHRCSASVANRETGGALQLAFEQGADGPWYVMVFTYWRAERLDRGEDGKREIVVDWDSVTPESARVLVGQVVQQIGLTRKHKGLAIVFDDYLFRSISRFDEERSAAWFVTTADGMKVVARPDGQLELGQQTRK